MTGLRDGGRSPRTTLRGLSLAEWEYAHRFADHLTTGDVRPDASGFDPERVAAIERTLRAAWHKSTQRMKRRR